MGLQIKWDKIKKAAENLAKLPADAILLFEVSLIGKPTYQVMFPVKDFTPTMWTLFDHPRQIKRLIVRKQTDGDLVFHYDRTAPLEQRSPNTNDIYAIACWKELGSKKKETLLRILTAQIKEADVNDH